MCCGILSVLIHFTPFENPHLLHVLTHYIVMRNCSLSYSAALLLARESHHLISPNPGFELQLRIWGHCNYDVIEPSRKAGKPVSEGKAAYKAWEKYRDELLGRNVNDPVAKAHFSMVAKLAANFGKQKAIRAYHDVAED